MCEFFCIFGAKIQMIIRFWWVYCIINFWIGKMAKLMDDISLFSWKAYHVWLETCSRCIGGSCKSYCYVIFTSSFVSYFWREISEPYFLKFPALFVYISNWPARQRKSKFSITKETIFWNFRAFLMCLHLESTADLLRWPARLSFVLIFLQQLTPWPACQADRRSQFFWLFPKFAHFCLHYKSTAD